MKRTAVYLKDSHLKKLQELSKRTHITVSELIRMAIEEYLKRGRSGSA